MALKDYDGHGDELSFLEGDRFQVIDDTTSLWRAINMATQKIGFIPPDLVKEAESEDLTWFKWRFYKNSIYCCYRRGVVCVYFQFIKKNSNKNRYTLL